MVCILLFLPTLLSGSRGEQEWKMSGGVNSTRVFPRVSPSFSVDLGCRSISPDMQGEYKCTFRHWLLIAEMYAGQAHCSGPWPFWLSHKEAGRPTAAAHSATLQITAKLEPQSPLTFSYDKKKHLRVSGSKVDRYNILFPPLLLPKHGNPFRDCNWCQSVFKFSSYISVLVSSGWSNKMP